MKLWTNKEGLREKSTLQTILDELKYMKKTQNFSNKWLPSVAKVVAERQMEKLYTIVTEAVKQNKHLERVPGKIIPNYIAQ